MKKFKDIALPKYNTLEEILNSVSHGIGFIFSLVAFIFLMQKHQNNFKNMVIMSIYGFSLMFLYLSSTLYHSISSGKTKNILRKFDHCSIFLLIAGTYTPICTILINNTLSWLVLYAVWAATLTGIVLNIISINKFEKISLILYITMGWSIILIAKPAWQNLSSFQLKWLILGGVFYTIGAALYVIGKKKKYIHSIWHVFVLIGSICHFITIY
ncbi:MAG: hemolysin III family protein [Clostridia bacterium]|nr:hemolysin III family protein [Clostridia bacterium]